MNNSDMLVGIIDDDTDFIDILRLFLKKIGIVNVKTANSIKAGKTLLETTRLDLVILDIDFGEVESGIELGTFIRENYPNMRIVFFTNNFKNEFYEAAKKVQPNAFLDKELSELKVRQTVELAFLQEKSPASNISQFSDDFIFIKIGMTFKKILLADIDYIVYSDRYPNLVIEGKYFPLNVTMRDLAKNLPSTHFMQIHQSYIVNLNKIIQINMSDNQVEIVGKFVPIGISFRKALQTRLTLLT
jgi:DNA-binding LytR/AlgR family response regulator